MPTTLRRGGLLALLLLVPVASASGATLTPLSKCARWTQKQVGTKPAILVSGTGWQPGDDTTEVGYLASGRLGYIDIAGDGTFTRLGVPAPASFRQNADVVQGTYGFYARSPYDPAIAATTSLTFVKLKVVTPKSARPSGRVRYAFYGFPNQKRIYAHYTYGGKRRALTDMGTAKGACGKVSKRQRYLPAKTRYGKWYVYYANTKSFRKAKKSFIIRGSFTIRKVSLRKAASAAAAGHDQITGPGARALVTPFIP